MSLESLIQTRKTRKQDCSLVSGPFKFYQLFSHMLSDIEIGQRMTLLHPTLLDVMSCAPLVKPKLHYISVYTLHMCFIGINMYHKSQVGNNHQYLQRPTCHLLHSAVHQWVHQCLYSYNVLSSFSSFFMEEANIKQGYTTWHGGCTEYIHHN